MFLHVLGSFLILDVVALSLEIKRVRVSYISKQATLGSQVFNLEGFINFAPPVAYSRKQDGKENNENDYSRYREIGHYTTVILQKNGKWVEIDDLSAKEDSLKKSWVVPHVIVYSK